MTNETPPAKTPADLGAALADPERELRVLIQGTLQAEAAYREEPTEARHRAWTNQLEALRRAREALAPPAPVEEPTFATLERATAYLRGTGRKCAKSKLAKDTGAGLVGRTADGAYTQHALDKYGEKHCPPLSGVNVEEADDYWRKRKQRAEAKKLEHEAEIKELQKRRELGELIERTAVYRELTARLAVLRADFENMTHEMAIQIAERYGIEAARVGELQQDLAECGEDWFSKYGDKREFVAHLTGDADE